MAFNNKNTRSSPDPAEPSFHDFLCIFQPCPYHNHPWLWFPAFLSSHPDTFEQNFILQENFQPDRPTILMQLMLFLLLEKHYVQKHNPNPSLWLGLIGEAATRLTFFLVCSLSANSNEDPHHIKKHIITY